MPEPSSRSSKRGAFRKGTTAQTIAAAAKRATTTKTAADRAAKQDRVAEAEKRQREVTEQKLGKEKIAEILELKKKEIEKVLINFNGTPEELRALINDKHAQLKNVKDEYVEKYFRKFDKPKNIEDIQKIINSVNDEEEAINKLLNFENEILKMEPQSNEEKKFIFKTLIIDEKAQLENVSLNDIYIDEYFIEFVRLKSIGEYPKNKEDIQNIINSVNDIVNIEVKKVEQTTKREAESEADEKLRQEKRLIDFIISNTKKILEKYEKIPNATFSKTDIDNFRSYLIYGSTLLKDVNEEHTKKYLNEFARLKSTGKYPKNTKDIQEIINDVNLLVDKKILEKQKETRLGAELTLINKSIPPSKIKKTIPLIQEGWKVFYDLKALEQVRDNDYKRILKIMMNKNRPGYAIFKSEEQAMADGEKQSTKIPLTPSLMYSKNIRTEIDKVVQGLTEDEKDTYRKITFKVAEGRKRRSKKNKKKKGSKKLRGAQSGKKQSKRRRPAVQKKSRKKKN